MDVLFMSMNKVKLVNFLYLWWSKICITQLTEVYSLEFIKKFSLTYQKQSDVAQAEAIL